MPPFTVNKDVYKTNNGVGAPKWAHRIISQPQQFQPMFNIRCNEVQTLNMVKLGERIIVTKRQALLRKMESAGRLNVFAPSLKSFVVATNFISRSESRDRDWSNARHVMCKNKQCCPVSPL